MTNISFKSENFKIDFLSFNTQFNDEKRMERIANYLSDAFKCNSKFEDKKNLNRNRTLVDKKENSLKVFFRANQVEYWSGITIDFTGNDANCFYNAIKHKPLDWDKMDFDNTNLGRIDLCYDRKIEKSDTKEDFNVFLESCKDLINKNSSTTTVEIKENILRVGSRKSSNFFRVYKRPNGRHIRFELEIKKILAKKYQSYLFANQLEKFEELISKHFYNQAVKTLVMTSCYTDWLSHNFRKAKNEPRKISLANSLAISYLTDKPFNDVKEENFIYKLFQLLNYIRTLENHIESIDTQNYRIVSFYVNNFLQFIGEDKTKHYQVRKVVNFLRSLQERNFIIEHFSDNTYQRAVSFPYFKITKDKSWCVKIAIAEELYCYNYPFNFPKSFLICSNTYDLRVKLLILKSFATTGIEKVLSIEDFLLKFNVPNSVSTKLKGDIVQLIHQLRDSNLIKSRFILMTKENKLKIVNNLNIYLITKSKYIFYKENTNFNHF